MKKWFLIVIFSSALILVLCILKTDRTSSKFTGIESNCGRFSHETEIILESDTWQTLKTPEGSLLYFQNAYFDSRQKQNVTIPAFGIGFAFTIKTIFCQFWIEGEVEPVVREASIKESSLKISKTYVRKLTKFLS